MSETVETLQEKINNRADCKCEQEMCAAFKQFEAAVASAGIWWDKISIGTENPLVANPAWIMQEMRKHFVQAGKLAYRKSETNDLLQKLDAVQQHIETLQQQ